MKRVCVFCGSSPGSRPEFTAKAGELGRVLAGNGIGLVYGGAKIGMMGAVASAALEANGEVIGIIPRDLVNKEIAFTRISDLRVVNSMHERKALMAELSDGFIALPGGLGTIEEFFEILTWAQLGIHKKPCGLLNVCGYYDKMIEFFDQAVQEQFINPSARSLVLVDESPPALLKKFQDYRPPKIDKAAWALALENHNMSKT
ncbi:TIGR00730 family Rossman fold protein [Methanocella sp.]|uniref:LOG family protein n=1 Tax=Methanocella sp. TaxID=2052833 RepID=UPI0032C22FA6